MKQLFLLIAIFTCILLFTQSVDAITPTVSPTPTIVPTKVNDQTQAIDQKINELKNKISNKVSQLKLVDKRGFIGTVTDSTNTQITLTDIHGNIKNVDVDELTKFSSSTVSTFGISDVKKGMILEILGLYNKQSLRTLARIIKFETESVYLHGAVSSIDNKHFNAGIVTDENKNKTLSITVGSTKIESYTKTGGLTKAKFSDISTSEHIIATGFWDKTDKNTLNVSHLFLLSELPKDPKIIIQPTPTPEDTIVPSTGNGKKLTPLKPIQ